MRQVSTTTGEMVESTGRATAANGEPTRLVPQASDRPHRSLGTTTATILAHAARSPQTGTSCRRRPN